MSAAGIGNKQAFFRKMILEGYVVRVDFSDVREMIRMLRNATNNLNQVAKRVNASGSIIKSDIANIQQNYEKLWEWAEVIAKKLAHMKC
jgi:ABC-type transporter Mla subunit MlaD